MNILILGGGGFIGQKLVKQLVLANAIKVKGTASEISTVTIFDVSWPEIPVQSNKTKYIRGSLTNPFELQQILAREPEVIFHLAAVVSGQAEKDFELGMDVNLHANLHFLNILKKCQTPPVVIFASSCAVFGGELSDTIFDHTAATPMSSYGTQKAIVELLMNDYSRRGYIDARILRLPTIAIRPGKPNAATSSFVSSIIREPMMNKSTNCPVDKKTLVWILSPRRLLTNLLHATALSESDLDQNRIITLPGITVSVADMINSLASIGGIEKTALITWLPDQFIESIVLTWPPHFKTDRADNLGFIHDKSIDEIIQDFIEDDL